MKLGAFSISLNVKDIKTSKQFYENLGFTVFAGELERNYLIMKNENSLIGLFQGMFENNIITFNPGLDQSAGEIESFDDVREIQKQLKSKEITSEPVVDQNSLIVLAIYLRRYGYPSIVHKNVNLTEVLANFSDDGGDGIEIA